MSEHRIKFVQLVNASRDLLNRHPKFVSQLVLLRVILRQKFVQRRVEKPDCGGESIQFGEDADEIFALIRQQFVQRFCSICLASGQNHFAHRVDAIAFEEHMLGPTEADTLGAESHGIRDLIRRISVGADVECAVLIDGADDALALNTGAIGREFSPAIDPGVGAFGAVNTVKGKITA